MSSSLNISTQIHGLFAGHVYQLQWYSWIYVQFNSSWDGKLHSRAPWVEVFDGSWVAWATDKLLTYLEVASNHCARFWAQVVEALTKISSGLLSWLREYIYIYTLQLTHLSSEHWNGLSMKQWATTILATQPEASSLVHDSPWDKIAFHTLALRRMRIGFANCKV